MSFDFLYNLYLKFFSFYEEMSHVILKMCNGLHVKYSLLLSDFDKNMNFLNRLSKNPQISNFMKIRPVGAELFHADGRTDMTKLIVASYSSVDVNSCFVLVLACAHTVHVGNNSYLNLISNPKI